MKRFVVLTAALAFFVFAVGAVGAAGRMAVPMGQEFTLRPGGSVRIAGESLTVRFNSVVEDSRCPASVTCIWEGNARISVTLYKSGSEPGKLLLNTNPQFATSGSYLRYTISLKNLEPYPATTDPIAARRYRATLVVTPESVA